MIAALALALVALGLVAGAGQRGAPAGHRGTHVHLERRRRRRGVVQRC